MSLNWNWDQKVGEAVIRQGEKEYTLNLYQGNAFLIFISEYQDENGSDVYSLYSFFADREHMKNCLGLNKKDGHSENIFGDALKKVRINKSRYSYTKELVQALAQAFDEISIELYTEDAA